MERSAGDNLEMRLPSSVEPPITDGEEGPLPLQVPELFLYTDSEGELSPYLAEVGFFSP